MQINKNWVAFNNSNNNNNNNNSYYYYSQPFATKDFFQDVEYHYDNILEKLNLQTLHIRRRHFDALFLINVFCDAKYCPCAWKLSASVFPLGTYVTLPRSVAPSATALQ
jgi:hypothetical protein